MPERTIPAKTIKTKFWTYYQNNSGGNFVITDNIQQYVIIEAQNYDEANLIAESKGLYFDGEGDCKCCGNRWFPAWNDNDGTEEPLINETPPKEYKPFATWSDNHTIIHYYDGTKEII